MIDTDLYEGARYYAKAWTLRERTFVEGLASTDPATRLKVICNAGGYFRISRSLRTAFDVGIGLPRLKPVLDALDQVHPDSVSDATLHEVVSDLRRSIGKPYGNRDLLSAATKFLWLRHRDVVVIHDSQARLALGAPSGDYATYLNRWYTDYTLVSPQVTAACERLQDASDLEKRISFEVKRHGTAEWFKRRVFDIYLWRKGASDRAVMPNTR